MDQDTHAQIIEILDTVDDMTLATVRSDGFPQATTVSFVHDDLTLYFGTYRDSQKAQNIARCDKVSATVTKPHDGWDGIEGLSLGGHAREVTDPEEIASAKQLLMSRHAQSERYEPDDPARLVLFRVDPVVITILDYSRGFGHTERVDVQPLIAARS